MKADMTGKQRESTPAEEPANVGPNENGPDYERLSILGTVFTPAAPIDDEDLFRGRIEQLDMVIQSILRVGQHSIVYGDRGVGKTSLVNVVEPILQKAGENTSIRAVRVTCDASDSFRSAWRKVFDQVPLDNERPVMGFGHQTTLDRTTMSTLLPPGRLAPNDVRQLVQLMTETYSPVIIFDEFDRLRGSSATSQFADTIKVLSDHRVGATLILVGVSDSVDSLIHEHASIDRCLVQVRMPRMSAKELAEIITKGLERAHMTVDGDALAQAVWLSKGLPHYTHLIALNAAVAAANVRRRNVTLADVQSACRQAVQGAQETIVRLHYRGTTSPQKDALYRQVLLACAISPGDALGYFQPSSIAKPLREIVGRRIEQATYTNHLNEFCAAKRGPLLERTPTKPYRFRFLHPLMQPYVIMIALDQGLISNDMLGRLAAAPEAG
jgi:Cdc6-like AAA superfamily ATPase